MNLAVLRVSGADARVETLQGELNLRVDCSWKEGDQKRRGDAHENSGFCATLADAKDVRELMMFIHDFLSSCEASGVDFANVDAEIDIGIAVGSSDRYVGSVALPAADLMRIAKLGIQLSVTAYPTSDEANAM